MTRSNPMGQPPLEVDLLRRVRARDAAAMEAFFVHFFDRVHGYVANLLKDAARAEDLTQEAFLRLHQNLDRLDPERDPSGWVFTVVTNVVRDFWRSAEHRRRGGQMDLDELWNLPDEGGPSALEGMELDEQRRALRRSVDALSPADREIILLRSYEGLATPEVAGILGIEEGAARQRYSRAVKRLGELVKRREAREKA